MGKRRFFRFENVSFSFLTTIRRLQSPVTAIRSTDQGVGT